MRLHTRPGQLLVEVLISIAYIALMASTVLLLFSGRLQTLTYLRHARQAQALAEQGVEATRAIRDRGWEGFATGTHGLAYADGLWGFQGASDTADGFTRQVTVTELALNKKQVDVNVSWELRPSQTATTTLRTIFTDWRSIGPPFLSGNWANPRTLGSIDLGAGNAGTSLAEDAGKIYMTALASDAKKHDLYVIDVTNGSSPAILGSVNTGSGLNSVAVSGTRVYAAGREPASHLQIIDVSVPSSPALTSSFQIPGNTSEAISVNVSGGYAYVGTKQDAGPEFFVINVSNPSNPTLVGTFEAGGDITDIVFYRGYVFLATTNDTKEFIVLNAGNPASPTQVASMDAGSVGDGAGLYVNTQDYRAYLVRSQVSGSNSPELVIYNVASPSAPVQVGTFDFSVSAKAVFAADSLGFFGVDLANNEFQIFNVNNPASIIYQSGLNFPQTLVDFAFADNMIYAAVRSNDALRIITSQ